MAVDCCVAKGERIVEQSGHRWTVDRDDHLCELRAGEDVLGTLVVRRRDDRRLVGRLELDGQVVKLGATDRKASPGHTAPWEMIPNGKAGAWELDLDGRLVGVVGTGPQALLQVTPDLPEAQRRAVGCAATVLAVLQIDSLGAGQ